MFWTFVHIVQPEFKFQARVSEGGPCRMEQLGTELSWTEDSESFAKVYVVF